MQRHDQPVAVPRARAAAAVRARVDVVQRRRREPQRVLQLEQRAALLLELGREHRRHVGEPRPAGTRRARRPPSRPRRTAAAARRRSGSSTTTLVKPSASRMPAQTAASRSSLDSPACIWADTRSRCSTAALWRRAAAIASTCSSAAAAWSQTAATSSSRAASGRRPSSGASTDTIARTSPPESCSGTSSEVLGVPVAGVVGGRERGREERLVVEAVDAPGGDEVGAAVVEPLLEQLAVLGPGRRLAEQLLARRVVALEQHDLEVVPRGPVAVDADALEAGRAAQADSATAASTASGSPPPARSARPMARTPWSGSCGTGDDTTPCHRPRGRRP